MADYRFTELGKDTRYSDSYNPSLLCPIPRVKARQTSDESMTLPFIGVDVWTAYELSWLNLDGLPQIAIVEFMVPCDSDSIVESKSFKLYLNSFIQTQFVSMEAVQAQLAKDLSAATGAVVDVVLYEISEYQGVQPISEPQGLCIDRQPLVIDAYSPDSSLLALESDTEVNETLYSHLLKTNCPVTDQPDWASVYIFYKGPKIARAGLLKYIVSYRQHQDFHEQCVEQIFLDIMASCAPTELSVYARYMRRGGLDINPFRSNHSSRPPLFRQVRQ
ncbi:MAG: NADPH-dependent 7-cyano-7-deazaguanine reductase QueF [Porticoccaceae bacterium]|nr:NADPH-dependent 7-cyano-7-deazaguanine reductase QueF [Porticoccaceae bacterium]